MNKEKKLLIGTVIACLPPALALIFFPDCQASFIIVICLMFITYIITAINFIKESG